MSMIRYSSEKDDLPLDQLDALFAAIGWRTRGEDRWREALAKSSFVCAAWDDDRIVGFARILEDGVMCMFYDVGVLPAYQGRKIGHGLMERLISLVKDRGYVSIGLFTWEGNAENVPFYESLGFEHTEAGMELRKYMRPE
jgi:GNAT superfamily N-acetyltransferase